MKKTISAFFSLIIVFTLSGCGSSDGTGEGYKNLDLSNTKIIENTPDNGKWKKISFENSGLNDQSADRIVKFATNYGVGEIDKNDILLRLTETKEDGTVFVPLSEYSDYFVADSENFPYVNMFYCSDDFYIEVQAATGGIIELDYRKNINSVLGLDFKDNAPWRPGFFSKSISPVDINDENATCMLNGKTVKITDAIKNAEKYILENDVLFQKSFGVIVTEAKLATYENGNQALSLTFAYTIDGIELDGSPRYPIEDEGGNKYSTYTINSECAMVTENTIDWIWLPAVDGGTKLSSEDCEIAVSREEACGIVSQKISQEYKFNVEEIQLIYAAQHTGDGASLIEPQWRFYITDIKAQEYSALYVYVSALDGEVKIAEALE